MCRNIRLGSLNTFCDGLNCVVAHRNSNAPLVEVNLDGILVMKNDTTAFLGIKGSSKSADPETLAKLLNSAVALAEWPYYFMLVEIGDSKVYTKGELESAQNLIEKAGQFKMPKKIKDGHKQGDSFLPIFDHDSMDELTLNFIKKTEEHINHVKEAVNSLLIHSEMNNNRFLHVLKC